MLLEALERDDFSSIPAPIYGKGFLRLYAEYLELDPVPLIEDYLVQVKAISPKQLKPLVESAAQAAVKQEKKEREKRKGGLLAFGRIFSRIPGADLRKLNIFSKLRISERFKQVAALIIDDPWKCLLVAGSVLIVLVFLVSGVRQCIMPAHRATGHRDASAMLKVPFDPPDSYLEMTH